MLPGLFRVSSFCTNCRRHRRRFCRHKHNWFNEVTWSLSAADCKHCPKIMFIPLWMVFCGSRFFVLFFFSLHCTSEKKALLDKDSNVTSRSNIIPWTMDIEMLRLPLSRKENYQGNVKKKTIRCFQTSTPNLSLCIHIDLLFSFMQIKSS